MIDYKSQIVHFSHVYRKGKDPHWIYVNLIIKPLDEDLKHICEHESKEHKNVKFYTNPEEFDKYLNGLCFHECEKKSLNDLFIKFDINERYSNPEQKGYYYDINPLLIYIEKFNVYRFHQYVTNNPITRGAIDVIYDLKNNNESRYGHFTWCSELIRAVKTLDLQWD